MRIDLEHLDAERQINALPQRDTSKPLIICDVDEVILEFIRPFQRFLQATGHRLETSSYRLTGNIRSLEDGAVSSGETVGWLLDRFFAQQRVWQFPLTGAREALEALAKDHDIVILTAMPSAYRTLRHDFLSDLGFGHPLVAANADKGALIASLASDHPRTIFIDDLPANHHSVATHAPGVELIHLMAFRDFATGIPDLPTQSIRCETWSDVSAALRVTL